MIKEPLNQNGLKKLAHKLIAWHMHSTDHGTLATFERLIEKATGETRTIKRLHFSHHMLTTKQLLSLKENGGHGGTGAASPFEPVLLLHHQSKFYILDGQKRINDWSANNVRGPHRCIVVRVKR